MLQFFAAELLFPSDAADTTAASDVALCIDALTPADYCWLTTAALPAAADLVAAAYAAASSSCLAPEAAA